MFGNRILELDFLAIARKNMYILTFFRHPTKLLFVLVPGKLKVASLPPTKAVLEARMEKLPEVIHRSV